MSRSVKPLREWSARRVLIASLAWLVDLPLLAAPAVFGAVGWLARAERERGAAAAPDSIAPGLRVAYVPPESGDFLISLAGPGVALAVGLFLLPPVVLWIAWMVARRQTRQPPAAASGTPSLTP